MAVMGQLHDGRLSAAWKGEAADFTPLLVDRLDQLGSGDTARRCLRRDLVAGDVWAQRRGGFGGIRGWWY
jgi:hypothetical protein